MGQKFSKQMKQKILKLVIVIFLCIIIKFSENYLSNFTGGIIIQFILSIGIVGLILNLLKAPNVSEVDTDKKEK